MSTLRTDTLQTTDSAYSIGINEIASLAGLAGTGAGQGAELVGRSTIFVDGVKNLQTTPTNKKLVASVVAYYEGGQGGAGLYFWDAARPKSQHNGGSIVSPTVPWTGSQLTLPNFLNAVGETVPAGFGAWVLIANEFSVTNFGVVATPGTNNFAALTKAVVTSHAAKIKLNIPSGTFEYGTTLDFSYPTLVVQGAGFRNSVLKFTGTGRAVDAIGTRPNNGIYSFDLDASDFTIEGNPNTTDLFRIRINHARIVRVNVREANTSNGCGFRIEGTVAGHYEQLTMSTNTQLMASRPANGIIIGADPSLPGSPRATCNTLTTVCIEGATADGIVLTACDQLTVMGGTSENNGGNGLTEVAGCQMNTYTGFDCEVNLGFADIFVGGQSSQFNNCGSTTYFYVDNSARFTKVEGGWFDKVEIGVGAVGVQLSNLKTRFFGGAVGLVTNNNPFLSVRNIFDVQANAMVFYAKPPATIGLTGSPQTYTNNNVVDETILVHLNGGTVTQIAYNRLGTPYLMNPATGAVRLQPGDGITINYTGSPVYTRIPHGTNNN